MEGKEGERQMGRKSEWRERDEGGRVIEGGVGMYEHRECEDGREREIY